MRQVLKLTFEAINGQLDVEDYIRQTVLEFGVKAADSGPPSSVNPSCGDPATKKSLEWLTKSPEYEMWENSKDGASLWLHGPPGNGKTFAAAYILKNPTRPLIYTKKRVVASIFCSSNDSDLGLVTSLALQLIPDNEDQIYTFQNNMAITKSQKYSQTTERLGIYIWKLLETLIMARSKDEVVIIIDGIDQLRPSLRTAFLENFCALETKLERSVVIRTLISSRQYPDIKGILGHYPMIERDKGWKGKHFERVEAFTANYVGRMSQYPLL